MTQRARVLSFPPATAYAFGSCPICGRCSGMLNVGPEHWFYCVRHQTKWLGATDTFSSWHRETEADWNRHRWRLSSFVEVDGTWFAQQTS
jgi:hypothetical protein